ncbi:MAG: exonuclease SbcCD subunit D [Chloroflexota bacterium]
MRFLHTADWHVGRTMRGRSRSSEFHDVLAEMIEIARDEGVEAMLVCGDIWDSAAPTPEADRLVYEALRECIGHGIQVVLLGGNHDSPRKLEALGLLSELLGVRTQFKVLRPDAGGIIDIEGRNDQIARIAAVPWMREGDLVDAQQVMGLQEQWFSAYADGAAQIYRAMCDGFRKETVNLLMGHVFVNGANYATRDGSERQLHIGQAYGIDPSGLPGTPQYIALGHIHRPQTLREASVHTEYAGSLLQLDFGETEDKKRVVVFDVEPGRPVRDVRSIELTKGRKLVELKGRLDDVLARALKLHDEHVRVLLQVDQPEPGLAQRVRDQVPGAVDVRLDYPELAQDDAPALSSLAADEQFARYYRSQHGAEPDIDTLALFRELHDAVVSGVPASASSDSDSSEA